MIYNLTHMTDVDKIKKLRIQTGAGIADCRKALEECGNDLVKACSWLKKQGIDQAAKKQDRQVSAGIVESYIHLGGKLGVLVELNCETDFVAKTDEFKRLAHELAMQISAMNPKNVNQLLKQIYIRDPQITIEELVKQHITKFGENITVNRFYRMVLGE